MKHFRNKIHTKFSQYQQIDTYWPKNNLLWGFGIVIFEI